MIVTPFETNGRTTTLAEEDAFLTTLAAASSGRMAVDVVGESVEGRPIRLVRIGRHKAPPYGSPSSALWVGLQHAAEPQSREVLFAWMRDLVETEDPLLRRYLADHPVFIMPTCNPDRVGTSQNNANGVNLNRDHMALSQPETRAIHYVLRRVQPQLVHDMHTGGTFDVDVIGGYAYQMDAGLREVSAELTDHVIDHLHGLGIGAGYYPTETSATTSNAVALRNAAGLLNSVTLLTEIRSSIGDPTVDPKYPDQVTHGRAAVRGVADWHAANSDLCTSTVKAARERAVARGIAADEPFSLGAYGPIIPVPPADYWLTGEQFEEVSEKLRLLGIGSRIEGRWRVVTMGQETYNAIPYVLDGRSSESSVHARPIGKPLDVRSTFEGMSLRHNGQDHPVRLVSLAVDGDLIPVWQNL